MAHYGACRPLSGWWLLVLASVACQPEPSASPQVPSPPVVSPVSSWVAPKPPPPDLPPLVPPPGGTEAGWVQSPSRAALPEPLRFSELIAVGAQAAVLRTSGGHFAVHRDRGVVGKLRLPLGWFWLGLDGGDRLYVATPEGALYRSDDATQRAGASFAPVALVRGAVTWDVAGSWLVAARGAEVLVSGDHGRSYYQGTVTPGLTIRRLRVRPDGVIAAWGHERSAAVTYLSGDGGRTWIASDFQPRQIDRVGAAIENGARRCPASLSRDGRTWHHGRPDALALEQQWTGQLRVTSSPTGSSSGPTLSDSVPGAMVTGAPVTGPEGPCGASPPRPASSGPATGSGSDGARACRGVNCLRGTGGRAVETGTEVGFLADAACRSDRAGPPGRCDPNLPLQRPPTMAVIDRGSGTVRLLSPPSTCRPRRLVSIRGAGLLACELDAEHLELYTLSRSGALHREASFNWPGRAIGTIATGDDGTTVITCDRLSCAGRALVRSPHPLGDPSAWREIAVPQVVAYRPLLLGAALALTSPATAKMGKKGAFGSFRTSDLLGGHQPGADPPTGAVSQRIAQEQELLRRMSMSIARVDGTVRPLATNLRSDGDVLALEVVDAAVYLASEPWGGSASLPSAKPPTYYRLDQGKLVALPRPPAALRRARKQSPPPVASPSVNVYGVALDDSHVYWTDTARGRVLAVAKRGGKVATLASHQPGAFAIAVDETHVYFTLRGSAQLADGSVRRVSKQGGTVEQIASDQLRPEAIVTDADAVYWTTHGYPGALDGAVLRASKREVATGALVVGLPEPAGIALDHGHVVFTTAAGGSLGRVPKSGGASQRLGADQLTPHAVTVSAGRIIWANRHGGTVATSSVDGAGSVTTIMRGITGILGLAVCGDVTYATTDRGSLWVSTEAGQRVLASKLFGSGSIACDGGQVYVSIHDGRRLVAIAAAGGKPRTLGGVTLSKPLRSKRVRPGLKH